MEDAPGRLRVDPIWVVGAPGVGSRALAHQLAAGQGVYSSDPGMRDVVDAVASLHPSSRSWRSGRLDTDAVSADAVASITAHLATRVRDRDDRQPTDVDAAIRVVDASPLHALRVPFLAAAFPTARFVYVHRAAEPAVAAASLAWRSGRQSTYPDLPGWAGLRWSFALVDGWRNLDGLPPEQVVAQQWRRVLETLLDDLDRLAPDRWCLARSSDEGVVATYDVERVAGFLGVVLDRPVVAGAAEAPMQMSAELVRALPEVHEVANRADDLFADAPPANAPSARSPQQHYGSTFSARFPGVLEEIGSSLLVTTYQSGRLVVCRARQQGLNTHFLRLSSPMGVAVGEDRFAVGTDRWIAVYRNHERTGAHLPDGPYDACFVPLSLHATGDIKVHELAFADDGLWAVSTRFSCLVTLDDDHSFVPQWKPPWVSAIAAEDRCHLNGFTLVDGRIAYASALGLTDTAGGWRDNKRDGGVIVTVPDGEPVVRGLSMPHSPRWYDDRLWVLESGKGSLGVVDLSTGEVETVAELPGFTRGLTFHGNYAFVGLSQVRESVFRGLPIVEREHRSCGVWIVDIHTGETVGTLEFTGAVQEIFDVQLLRGLRWPEVAEADGPLLDQSFVLPPVRL